MQPATDGERIEASIAQVAISCQTLVGGEFDGFALRTPGNTLCVHALVSLHPFKYTLSGVHEIG